VAASFLVFVALLGSALFAPALSAAVFDSAVALADVDQNATELFVGGEAKEITPEQLRWVLGFGGERRPWAPNFARGEAREIKETVHFRLVFKKPITIGTILGGIGEIRILKEDAPFPGDPENAAHWTRIETQSEQNAPMVAPLAPGTATRAILCTVREPKGRVELHLLRPLVARLHNLTPGAVANADAEFAPASLVTRANGGRGWECSGKDQKGFNAYPPITETQPSWFVLSWDAPRVISGLALNDNFERFTIQTFVGPSGVNPAVGTAEEWKPVKTFTQTKLGETRAIIFPAPITTRGIKFEITRTSFQSPQVARLDALNALLDIGNAPVPASGIASIEKPPFALPYVLPQGGKLTMVVNDAKGRRVRNLMANEARPAGAGEERWDLKDEDGKFVPPGRYEMKAITHPGLEMRYEMTAYPNVGSIFPDRTPWMNAQSGPGGWLADHSPPRSACVAGDRVYLGAPVAESGVSLIECDVNGKRLWAHPSFEAFTGAWWLASDGKTVFVAAPATNFAARDGLDKKTEAIWGVDVTTKAVRRVAMLPPTNTRNRGIQGIAARDNKVYLAIRAPEDWLVNAAAPADVDVQNCLPFYPVKRKERAAYEIVPDPRNDFIRLFRITGTPPGYGTTGLTYLESSQGGGRQQHIVVAFQQPVAIGSVVFPFPKGEPWTLKMSVQKPGSPYPPKADDASQWVPFTEMGDKGAFAVWTAPPDTKTRALRITFSKGADDLLADIEEPAKVTASLDTLEGKAARPKSADGVWLGRLEGMKLLARRFASLAPTAAIRVNSGKLDKDGAWDAQRTAPVSEGNPGIYLMEWREPQPVRGLAVKQMHAKRAVVEAYTGTEPVPPLASAEGWEKVGEFTQARHYHHSGFKDYNGTARYLDSYVDFGREVRTRAVRLRVVEQFLVRDEYGFRHDDGAQIIEPSRCRLFGVAPLRHLGGDAPSEALMNERLEVVDAATGNVAQEAPLSGVGETGHEAGVGNLLAFNPQGELFAAAGSRVLKVGRHSEAGFQPASIAPTISDIGRPTALTCDKAGNLYVFDSAPDRRNVRVYSPDGKFLREIGTPGGYREGAWDPNRFQDITALAVDSAEHLWAVDWTYYPKRISQWTTDGKFLQEFLGPTAYGGGGVLDPWDKSRLFYGPLEFELDWKTGRTRLKNLTWLGPTQAGCVPMRVQGRDYLVTIYPSHGPEQPYGAVYLHTGDRLRLLAAMGQANAFEPLRDPQLMAELGTPVLANFKFIFTDRNGDGVVQANEIKLTEKPADMFGVTPFQRDLSIQSGRTRWVVREFLPDGVPVYEEQRIESLTGRHIVRLDNGNFHRMGDGKLGEAALSPTGDVLWSYASEPPGVQREIKPWHPAQVASQFAWCGHETAQSGDLGEFFVIHTNMGAWNIWTADGLFAGQIFRDLRDPRAQAWSMAERDRGLRLDDVTPGQEHFWGYLCRTVADDKYYVVAGHNHASVAEVSGLGKFKRLNAAIEVSPADVARAQEWERVHQHRETYARAVVVDCFRADRPPKIDGSAADWPVVSATIEENIRFRAAWNDTHLFLCYEADYRGPFKNTGTQWDRLFKTGSSVDLQLSTDPAAEAGRKAPAAGDLRILMTVAGHEPFMVLYQPVFPGAKESEAWKVQSPVAELTFDRVTRLPQAQVFAADTLHGWCVEAAIPLAALGLKPVPNVRYKMDWGILTTGQDGNEVLRRIYWSNKATSITADAPSEARLHPDLWGWLRFHNEPANSHLDPTARKKDKTVDDLLNDLK
jgi:hypothetical protein